MAKSLVRSRREATDSRFGNKNDKEKKDSFLKSFRTQASLQVVRQ